MGETQGSVDLKGGKGRRGEERRGEGEGRGGGDSKYFPFFFAALCVGTSMISSHWRSVRGCPCSGCVPTLRAPAPPPGRATQPLPMAASLLYSEG